MAGKKGRVDLDAHALSICGDEAITNGGTVMWISRSGRHKMFDAVSGSIHIRGDILYYRTSTGHVRYVKVDTDVRVQMC